MHTDPRPPLPEMAPVLIVEDSNMFASLMTHRVQARLGLPVLRAASLAEAETRLREHGDAIFAALLDLNLPDAPNGEVVELVTQRDIPSIVFTGSFNDEVRDAIWARRIVDYVVKESPHSIDYIVDLLERLHRNRAIKILVVDDSLTARRLMADLLRVHQFQVLEAATGQTALTHLENNPDVKCLITDYHMPGMDGFELVKAARARFPKNRLAIIGVSAHGGNILSARFLKNGANDYITKPFASEEFYCRVTHNIEMLEHIETIQRLSDTDPLTGLHNRRFLFEMAPTMLAQARRNGAPCCVAMLDVDCFKKINDSWGHDAGDAVLSMLGSILKRRFRESDIVARLGGEEFCVLATNMDRTHAVRVFDQVRQAMEATPVLSRQGTIQFTVSIGLCTALLENVEQMIKAADERLYAAKAGGRNRVMA